MKTSKAEFKRFQKSFKYWAGKLKCAYALYFFHEDIGGDFANISVGEDGKVATVRMGLDLEKHDYQVRPSPELNGKHEAVHLFLWRLGWLGKQRYIRNDEIDDEAERLTRILEEVLLDK